eukprot:1711565-Amphidinium_carterae.1
MKSTVLQETTSPTMMTQTTWNYIHVLASYVIYMYYRLTVGGSQVTLALEPPTLMFAAGLLWHLSLCRSSDSSLAEKHRKANRWNTEAGTQK